MYSLESAVNFSRREFSWFLDSLVESGISKHVILEQLLETAIVLEEDLRKNYQTDDQTIQIIKNASRLFGDQIKILRSKGIYSVS